jgi:hypothetical protein
LLSKKVGQVLLIRLGKDGEVAAVDHLHIQTPGRLDQPAETRMQLRRAAGQVERGQVARFQHARDELDGCVVHRFGTVRACVDVAVQAGLVAAVAEVDLQGGESATLQFGEIRCLEEGKGVVHETLMFDVSRDFTFCIRLVCLWNSMRQELGRMFVDSGYFPFSRARG